MVAFQQNSSGWPLPKICEICEHLHLHFFFFWKGNITLNNYLIIIEHVDKLPRKMCIWGNIGSELEGICTMSLDYVTFYWILTGNLLDSDLWFGLCYILLDLDWKSFGQFIITLIRYVTGIGLENTWTTNLDYNY